MPNKIKNAGKLIAGATLLSLSACGPFSLPPAPTDLHQRLAMLPNQKPIAGLKSPVTIRWNRFQVPYVIAEEDADGAFALGMVHAHLRLGQMEFARLITQGRLAEVGGVWFRDLDVALRTLDYYGAVKESLSLMPPHARKWLGRYVDGVNYYKENAAVLPHEYRVLGLANEPWSAEDTVAIGKMAGTDVNWLVWFSLFDYMGEKGFDEVLAHLQAQAEGSTPSFEGTKKKPSVWLRLARLGFLRGKSGSNSMVISPERSLGKGALIASDPHLGFALPNLWILAGLRSPSYKIVGMMPTGVPVFGFGRNPTLAWGGTNLRAQASDLVALGDEEVSLTRHQIRSRWWLTKTFISRKSRFGPVISDPKLVNLKGEYALAWVGHRPADELTSLLDAMAAEDWGQFQKCFDRFAVPGQNFLAADSKGNIGYLLAAHLPKRRTKSGLVMTAREYDKAWSELLTAAELPKAENPKEGYFASANNRPAGTKKPLIGTFFPEDERIRRLKALLAENRKISTETLKKWQLDVYSPLSVELRNALTTRLLGNKWANPYRHEIAALNNWDGNYSVSSTGALLFEGFVREFYEELLKQKSALKWRVFNALGRQRSLLLEEMKNIDDKTWRRGATAGLKKAGELMASGQSWGDRHRFQVQHMLGRTPLIGRLYRYDNLPSSGSNGTLKKSAHRPGSHKQNAFYGSQSRHISDLGDPDANYFLLLGGNDGWINSANFADQMPLWQDGEYIRMPLTPQLVEEEFPHALTLLPERR